MEDETFSGTNVAKKKSNKNKNKTNNVPQQSYFNLKEKHSLSTVPVFPYCIYNNYINEIIFT